MKSKIGYIILVLTTFFVGVCSTLIIIYYIPKQKCVTETVNQNITVVETDTIASAVNKLYDAVVTVENYKTNLYATGTGFVYKTDDLYGYILTNNHVISEAKTVKVVNNQDVSVEAMILGKDEYADLAVLRIEKEAVLQVALFGNSLDLKIGDTVFAVGTPISITYQGSVTKGIISGLNRVVTVDLSSGGQFMMDVIQTNAAINPGNSGGPLANINGEVVGINTLKLVKDEIEGMGFSIPIEMATSVLDRLEKGEKIERPKLGISLLGVDETYNLYRYEIRLDKDFDYGVVVVGVEENSSATQMGLEKEDIILKINDVVIKDPAHFRYVLYKYHIGETVKIEYYHKGEIKTIDVILENSL